MLIEKIRTHQRQRSHLKGWGIMGFSVLPKHASTCEQVELQLPQMVDLVTLERQMITNFVPLFSRLFILIIPNCQRKR